MRSESSYGWLQQDAVDNGEHRRVGADAEREGQHGRCGKARASASHAGCKPKIVGDRPGVLLRRFSQNAGETLDPDLRPLSGARRAAIAIGEDHRDFPAVLVAELARIQREQCPECASAPLVACRGHVVQPF
jgi:hypothetical protein